MALPLLLAAPLPARAQGAGANPLAELGLGTHVRVFTHAGQAVEGTLAAFDADSVRMRTGARLVALPAADVASVWVRVRSVRQRTLIGGAAGLLTGVALGGLLAALDGTDGVEVARFAGSTALVGAGGAAGIGDGLSWRRVYHVGPDGRAVFDGAGDDTRPERRRGSVTLVGGFATLTGEGGSTGGPEARLSVLLERYLGGQPGGRRTFVSVGPEYGIAVLGDAQPRPHLGYRCEPACQDTVYARGYGAIVGRVLVRLGVEEGVFRGYAVAGAGVHAWVTTDTHDTVDAIPRISARDHYAPGATFGLGAQYRVGRLNALGIELRHNVVRTYERDFAHGFWGISATYTRTW